MTKRRKILLSIFFVLVTACCVFTFFLNIQKKRTQMIRNLSTEEKIQDFEALCTILDESYPFWNEARQAGVNRDVLYEEYRENIEDTDTDIEYFKEVQYFLKEFGGLGHLEVLDGQAYQLYLNTLAESEEMLSEAEKCAIEPLKSVLADANVKKTYENLDKSHSGFRSIVGLKEEYLGAESAMAKSQTSGLETKLLDDGRVAYIKIPDFQLVNYEADKIELAEFWKDAAGTSNLIIDIRGNSGGSDKYWEDLLVKPNAKETLVSERYFLYNENEMTREYILANEITTPDVMQVEAAQNPYKGEIWVLVDEKVYSASENFVMFCKNTGFANLVGTKTGGDGGVADPILISLPNSGLIVRFSIFYGLNADGTGNEAVGTTPDILISEDEDALEKCLSLF